MHAGMASDPKDLLQLLPRRGDAPPHILKYSFARYVLHAFKIWISTCLAERDFLVLSVGPPLPELIFPLDLSLCSETGTK